METLYEKTDKGKSIYCGRMRFGDSMAMNNILYSVLHKKKLFE